MDQVSGGFSIASFVIPVGILLLTIVVIVGIRTLIKQYKRVAPNMVAVVFGKRNGEKGYRIVTGGGFFLWPVIEEVKELSLNIMSIEVAVVNAPDKNGVLLSVKGVANVKIRSQLEHLPAAIERFLGKSEDEIKRIAKDNLEGNLRALTGTLTVEELIQDRTKFQAQVLGQVGADMAKLGLDIDLLNIQNITDEMGYITSLGRKQTAGVIRDAQIGEAEAQRETAVRTSVAKREGEVAQALAEQEISDAERERDEIRARNAAQVQAAQARIEIIAQSAAAEEQKGLNVATVAAEQAQVEAEISLQDAVRRRTEAALNATTIVNATKEKEASVITAEGKKQARIITAQAEQESATLEGEARRILAEKTGQGEQARMSAEAVGRKASAEATQAEQEAVAAGTRANLLAEAAGREASLLAEAKGVEARLLAEATGTLKKAEAFKELDEAGRFLLIMEALPAVIAAVGDAASKVIVPAAEAIGEGLANVDEIRLINMGGGQNGGENVLSQFSKMPVETLYGLLQKINMTELSPVVRGLMAKAGIDLDAVMKKPSKSSSEIVSEPTSVADSSQVSVEEVQ